jgi:hypothetical protein
METSVDESFITLARDIKKRLIDTAEQTGAATDPNANGGIKNLGKQQQQPAKADKKCCS